MDQPLDVFGQQPGLNKLYTQLCFCFALPAEDRIAALLTLQRGLKHLTVSVPWLEGEVTRDSDSQRFYIQRDEHHSHVVVQDLSNDLPGMDELRATGFSAAMLDEKMIAPCETIRSRSDAAAPVFLVQANLVNDGLLLVLSGLHSCMDMSGQGKITSLFANACRGAFLSAGEKWNASLRGDGAIPFLGADELANAEKRLPQNRFERTLSHGESQKASGVWSYFIFSNSALGELKSEATATSTASFISTDDALSAFLWQSMTRARLWRFEAGDIVSTFTRTVDARKAAGIQSTYTGNAAVKTACRMTFQELSDLPLGVIASQLREGLANVGLQLRLEATLLGQGKPTNKLSVEPSTGVNLSSWAKENSYELDLGSPLGTPEAVRRPAFEAWESLVYLMPKKQDGEIAVMVCLREEDMSRLKEDPAFRKSAQFAG